MKFVDITGLDIDVSGGRPIPFDDQLVCPWSEILPKTNVQMLDPKLCQAFLKSTYYTSYWLRNTNYTLVRRA